MAEASEKRFVVLRHQVGAELDRTDETHFDWMFELTGTLRTFATPVANLDQSIEVAAQPLSDHRLAYLEYEGPISGNRGRVDRVIGGVYESIEDGPDRFVFALTCASPEMQVAVVEVYRSLPEDGLRLDDNREGWRLRFSPGRYETNR